MPVNLAAIELKLLVVFDAVFTERNVTRAAHRLAMSQPAVSSALNRFRDLMNDQLFLRTRDGMQPTSRAVELAVPVQRALRQLEAALESTTIEPFEGEWSFDIAISDHASVVLLPFLIEHMNEVAPRTKLRFQSRPDIDVPGLLDANEADLALGIVPELPNRFNRAELMYDRYICMMRRNHPLASEELTLETFQKADHLAIKPGNYEVSRSDRMLEKQGVRRRIGATVHQFLAAPAIIARSDMIGLVFERMASVFDTEKFHFCPVPAVDLRVRVDVVWNRVYTNHTAHRWLRRQIVTAAARASASLDDAGV